MAESKRTPMAEAVILAMLKRGCTHTAAYGMARIARSTFYEWLNEDPEFAASVKEAEALAEAEWLTAAVEQDKDGRNRLKLMTLRFRDDWGERIAIEHTGAVEVVYTNSWRSSDPAVPPPGTEASTD